MDQQHHCSSPPPGGPANYINNLIGQPEPLQRHIWTLISGLSAPDPETDGHLQQKHIYIHNLRNHQLPSQTSTHHQLTDTNNSKDKSESTMDSFAISLSTTPTKDDSDPPPDFSYLMILELRDFYQAKYSSFRKCMQTCEDMCDVTYSLYAELETSTETIYRHTQAFTDISANPHAFHIAAFGQDIRYQAFHAIEQLMHIGTIMCPIQQQLGPPINLSSYKDRHFSAKNRAVSSTQRLQTILHTVVSIVYGAAPTITTTKTAIGDFRTCVSGGGYSQENSPTKAANLFEAEADSIYRFLRRITNELGYNIVDPNYPTLRKLVSEINTYNAQINKLQICATITSATTHRIYEDIQDMHEKLIQEVSDEEDITELNALVDKLLSIIQDYNTVQDNLSTNFRQNKQAYRAIGLHTMPPSTRGRSQYLQSLHKLRFGR